MTSSSASNETKPYVLGQAAFERGQYREAIAYFEEALSLVSGDSRRGGEIQIWLVTAYDAAGRSDAALTLCRKLRNHTSYETRQQAKQLLYVLEAPKLQLKSEWLTQIPEIKDSGEVPRYRAAGQGSQRSAPASPAWQTEPMEPIDPKESRGFLGLALGLSAAILGIWWLSTASANLF